MFVQSLESQLILVFQSFVKLVVQVECPGLHVFKFKTLRKCEQEIKKKNIAE